MAYSDKDRQREYQRDWRTSRREAFFADKSCEVCGSTERLELDHIDPNTKLYNPAALWGMSVDNPKRVAELAKCQVLCFLCHAEKTRRDLSMLSSKELCSRGHDMSLTRVGRGRSMCNYCEYLRRPLKTHKTLDEWLAMRLGRGTMEAL